MLVCVLRHSDWDFFFHVTTYTAKKFSEKKNTPKLIIITGCTRKVLEMPIYEMNCG